MKLRKPCQRKGNGVDLVGKQRQQMLEVEGCNVGDVEARQKGL